MAVGLGNTRGSMWMEAPFAGDAGEVEMMPAPVMVRAPWWRVVWFSGVPEEPGVLELCRKQHLQLLVHAEFLLQGMMAGEA